MSGKITKGFDDAFRKFTKMINNSTDDNIIKNIMEFGRFKEAGILQKMTTLTDKKNVEVANNKYGMTTLIIIKIVKNAMNQMNYEGIKNLADDFLKKNNIQIKKMGGGFGERHQLTGGAGRDLGDDMRGMMDLGTEIFLAVGCIALFVVVATTIVSGLMSGGKKHRKSKKKKRRKSKKKKRRKSIKA